MVVVMHVYGGSACYGIRNERTENVQPGTGIDDV